MKTTLARNQTKVPFVNLVGQHRELKEELLEAIGRVLDRGQFILGEEVEEFERKFSELCGVRFALGVNSGTDALIFALRVLGIGEGDEVITVPNSFVATTGAIFLVGARPVFVDVGEDYNLDPRFLERAVTSRTRAILPVHLTGRATDMDPILEVAKRHRLAVIEDAAQAVMAEYRGKRVGSLGTIGCFSLHPLKTLNACGDGGVLTTQDETLYEKLKLLRNLGLLTRDQCVVWSNQSRLDSLQAAVLLVKLKYLSDWTEKRRENAQFYQRELAGARGLKVPADRPHERAVYHTFVVQAERRDELKRFLAEQGIETAIHYPLPIHLQDAAKGLGYRRGSFPVAERQAERILSLPVYPELTQDQKDWVVTNLRKFYGS